MQAPPSHFNGYNSLPAAGAPPPPPPPVVSAEQVHNLIIKYRGENTLSGGKGQQVQGATRNYHHDMDVSRYVKMTIADMKAVGSDLRINCYHNIRKKRDVLVALVEGYHAILMQYSLDHIRLLYQTAVLFGAPVDFNNGFYNNKVAMVLKIAEAGFGR